MHKAKKEVLVEKKIADELTLVKELSNTDLGDNSVHNSGYSKVELQMAFLNQKGPFVEKVYKLQES